MPGLSIALMDTASTVLSFDPDPEELARVMTRHLAPMAKSARRYLLLGAFLIAAGVFSLVFVETRPNDVIAGGGIIVGLLIIRGNSSSGRRFQFRIFIKRSPVFTAHREVTAAADGLRMVTPTSDLRFFWSHYENVVRDDLGVTLVIRGGTTATFVPRRAFADAVAESAWERQVSAWVAEASGIEET